MAVSVKRKDKRGRVLRDGEQQRADGRYMYVYTYPFTKKVSYIFSLKLEAHDPLPAGKRKDRSLREKIRELQKNELDGIISQGGELSVLELVEKYISTKKGVRPTTMNGYRTVINHLKKDPFGKRRIDTVRVLDAKEWIIGMQKKGKSYSSIHTIRGVVRPAFALAAESDYIRKNPFNFELKDILINDSVRRDALDPGTERKFLEFVKNDGHFCECYDGMFILFKTGLRISELCGLTLRDIDMEKRIINVDHQLQTTGHKGKYIEKTKTGAGTRVLPMPDEVYEAFQRVLANRKAPKVEQIIDGYSGFLFLDKRGKAMVSYQWEKRFQRAVEKHNKIYKEELPRITPHICRHTYCTNMAKCGMSSNVLQYLMGHSSIEVTMNVYTHLGLVDAKREVDRIEAMEEVRKISGTSIKGTGKLIQFG